MIKDDEITQLDALIMSWEKASGLAISAQNERDAKFRLYLVGLGNPVDSHLTQELEYLWKDEATKREKLERYIRNQIVNDFDDLSLMQA